jgi:ABC-type antimicrobial peptide transport system permease subunit
MLKNYVKTAWRNLINHKVYSFLNIIGLATGMAIALVIGLWVFYQYSYDRFLPDYGLVYKAAVKATSNSETGVTDITPLPLGEALKKEIPGIRYTAQTWMGPHGLVYNNKKLYLSGGMVGADFLHILRYPFVNGNVDQALKDPYSIVLTESTAYSLFGKTDPIGRTIRIDNKNNLKVTGILRDLPANATVQFNYLVPFDYFIQSDENIKRAVTDWGHVTFRTYIALAPHVSYAQIEPLLKKVIAKYNPSTDYKSTKAEAVLLPLTDWHLYSEYKNGVASGGLIEYVKIFGIIGILVLLIACINFTNLSTARSEKRAREVGVRKVIGSTKNELVFQFLVESVLITFIAGIISLALVQIALSTFNQVIKADIHIPFDSPMFWSLIIVYVFFTGLLAGSRPAFYLSSFRPVKVLKGSVKPGKAAALPRKALVVLQFTCSIALIIGTVIIYQQIQHAQDRDKGYTMDRLVMTDFNKDLNGSYNALKNDLIQSGAVTSVTKSNSPVTDIWSEGGISNWPGKTSAGEIHVAFIGVTDADYFKTMDMQVVGEKGFFSIPAADSNTVVLNEAAVAKMGLKSPINQVIEWGGAQKLRIVGVVKNALMASPYASPMPTCFVYDPNWSNIVTYRLSPNKRTSEAIAAIEKIFNKYSPAVPFTYKFADETYHKKFEVEMLVGKLAGIFAAFAILISCIGLFGLAAYMAEQRNKEIGIRKVLGATVGQVWMLLSEEFIILVVVSSVIASPIAFYFLHGWLQKYEYRIQMSPLIFVGAGTAAVFITVLTVSFQSIKAGLANPAKSLKAE